MNAWKNDRRKWTVLVYSDGNNELEPEIYDRFRNLQEEVEGKDIYVVTQLARMPIQRLKLLRPQLGPLDGGRWTGTRRFVLEEGKNIMVEELGEVNMADPFTLYDFVIWGVSRYPSKNVMLVLSGHGAGFAGLMTDYTQDKPYIMTVDGFTNALYLSRKKTGKIIDCVLLDACYMNMVELWYELACIPKNTVKYILAPVQNIGLEGISYPTVFKLLEANISKRIYRALKIATKMFNEIHDINKSLLLIRASKVYFIILKRVINKEAIQLNKDRGLLIRRLNKKDSKIYREPLLSLITLEELLGSTKQKITRVLKNVIAEPSIENIPSEASTGPSLYFPFNLQQYEDVRDIYKGLRFSHNNEWVNIMEDEGIMLKQQTQLSYNSLPPPMVIPIKDVVAGILQQNTMLSQEEALEIVRQLWQIT